MDGSGCRVWVRRGLLPMSLSKGIVLMTRDRACFVTKTNSDAYNVETNYFIACTTW